jgi:hypothetical protein
MKKLLLALMLVSSVVHAQEEWWESENESGGKIVLLPYKCSRAESTTMRRMYSAHKNGKTWWGCWNFWADQVHVVYDEGQSYTYDPTLFVRKTKP